jgi:hypothetical protein
MTETDWKSCSCRGGKVERFGEIRLPKNRGQSGIGLPHSKTLARSIAPHSFREVLECGSPLPLLSLRSAITFLFVGLMLHLIGVWILLASGHAQLCDV